MRVTARRSLLDRQMPHAWIADDNPVFKLELQRVHGPHTTRELKRYSIIALVAVHGFVAAAWLAERAVYQVSGIPLQPTSFLYSLLLVAILAVTIGADLYYALITIGNLNRRIESGEWDLLRITELRLDTILAAQFAAAQVRAWRLMPIEVAIRLAAIVCVVLLNFNEALLILIITLAVSWPVPLLVAMYLIEPYWRMRAVVALCIWIALRVNNIAFAFLASLAGILLIQVLEVLIVGVPIFLSLSGALTLRNGLFCLLSLSVVAVVYAIYAFYRWVERFSLDRARLAVLTCE
jgi:hypothetical protein